MPEGHTLHRLALLHQHRYGGAAVAVSSPQGRFDSCAAAVDGRVLLRAEAHGKHLLHVYGPDLTVHVHLGLYGTFAERKLPTAAPEGQVRMRMVGKTHWTDLRGPNTCELLVDEQVEALHARLGPDPLRPDANPEQVWKRISRSRAPIAALLLGQRIIAGVGNVYRAEVLFRHRISPQRTGADLRPDEWQAIWSDLVKLMNEGVRTGRIDTVRPEHMPEATGREPRQDRHGGEVYVYRRTDQPCLICGTSVRMADMAGRNLYWCPTCQAR